MLIHNKKLIFIHIPKTGGSSIKQALFGKYISSHDHAGYYRDHHELCWNSYFKFSIVRNPWDRTFSIYNFYKNGNNPVNAKIKISMNEMSFEDFIHLYSRGEWLPGSSFSNPLLTQQLDWISLDGKIAVDLVVKFESLQEDYIRLCEELNIRARRLPHLKKMGNRGDYKNMYNDETKNIIYRRFKKDIEAFDYDF